jgi:hypothetical protein
MYSYEIDQTIKSHNYNIDSETYIDICSTSPQIFHLKYTKEENKFEIWTSDNYYWKIDVFRKDNGL